MQMLEFWQKFTRAIPYPADFAKTPVVVMIGALPHTIKSVRREDHEDGGSTLWIDAEES